MPVRISVLFCVSSHHMRNCKASGSLIVLLWHSVPFWPMIFVQMENVLHLSLLINWMELPTFKEAYISRSCNRVFRNENLNFRRLL